MQQVERMECLQEFVRQKFLADPTQWWNRGRNPTTRHPDFSESKYKVALWPNNGHKPAWLDYQPAASWDAPMKGPPESLSTSVEGQTPAPFERLVENHRMEVGMCRKLCEDGRITDAVDALNLLVQRGCYVDNNLFYHVLKGCISQNHLVLGTRIHALSIKSGHEGDAFLATHLIGLYASHGRLDEAMRVFTKVSTPSTYNWAAIILAHARHGEAAQAIRLYRQMRQSATAVKPDNHIYVAILMACAAAGNLVVGKEVHSHILLSARKPGRFVEISLIDMYIKCGSVEDARSVFDGIPDRNVVLWTAMIAAYAREGMGQEALCLYNSMQQDGLTPPNSVTFICLLQACASLGVGALYHGKHLHTQIEEQGLQDDVALGGSLVNMYAKCSTLQDARGVFDTLLVRNVIAWNAMLAGYAQQGMGHEALSLYMSMQLEGITAPDSVTFVCVLQACAIVAALPLGKQLHAQIEERGLEGDGVLGAALVDMYAKCGSMCGAQKVFESLPEKSMAAWGALTSGYSRQGNSEVVFQLVDRMKQEGKQPDGITFLSVLTVCSHVGLVDKGRRYFEAMKTEYGISPTVEHYACMMDLLGRAGHLKEALEMAKTMRMPPDGAVWRTLLGACRKWTNIEIGQQAFRLAVSVDGNDAAAYVLMSNIYASAEMWEEAEELQARRVNSG